MEQKELLEFTASQFAESVRAAGESYGRAHTMLGLTIAIGACSITLLRTAGEIVKFNQLLGVISILLGIICMSLLVFALGSLLLAIWPKRHQSLGCMSGFLKWRSSIDERQRDREFLDGLILRFAEAEEQNWEATNLRFGTVAWATRFVVLSACVAIFQSVPSVILWISGAWTNG